MLLSGKRCPLGLATELPAKRFVVSLGNAAPMCADCIILIYPPSIAKNFTSFVGYVVVALLGHIVRPATVLIQPSRVTPAARFGDEVRSLNRNPDTLLQ